MLRLTVLAISCLAPALAIAAGNPLTGGALAVPAGNKKYENVLNKGEEEKLLCDERGLAKDGTPDCKPVEPVYVPRDGVTDELLEKYRLQR